MIIPNAHFSLLVRRNSMFFRGQFVTAKQRYYSSSWLSHRMTYVFYIFFGVIIFIQTQHFSPFWKSWQSIFNMIHSSNRQDKSNDNVNLVQSWLPRTITWYISELNRISNSMMGMIKVFDESSKSICRSVYHLSEFMNHSFLDWVFRFCFVSGCYGLFQSLLRIAAPVYRAMCAQKIKANQLRMQSPFTWNYFLCYPRILGNASSKTKLSGWLMRFDSTRLEMQINQPKKKKKLCVPNTVAHENIIFICFL